MEPDHNLEGSPPDTPHFPIRLLTNAKETLSGGYPEFCCSPLLIILAHPGIKVVVQTTLRKELNNGVVGTAGSKAHPCLSKHSDP